MKPPRAAGAEGTAAAPPEVTLVKSSRGTLNSIGFHRVERRSLTAEAVRGTTYVLFTDSEATVCLPLLKGVRAALYSSETDPEKIATDTEDEMT
eukprot:1557629-Heterocapsa_arctica.AAC.1